MNSLDQATLLEMFEIEKRNMTPILLKSGMEFDEVKARESIFDDSIKNVLLIKNGELKGYVRFRIKENKMAFITSLQLANPQSHKIYLRQIIDKGISELIACNINVIESVVQKANIASQRLHEKLGFKIIEEFEKATRYQLKLI